MEFKNPGHVLCVLQKAKHAAPTPRDHKYHTRITHAKEVMPAATSPQENTCSDRVPVDCHADPPAASGQSLSATKTVPDAAPQPPSNVQAHEPVQPSAETQAVADQATVITPQELAAVKAEHATKRANMQVTHGAEVSALKAQVAEGRALFLKTSNEKKELEREKYDLQMKLAAHSRS